MGVSLSDVYKTANLAKAWTSFIFHPKGVIAEAINPWSKYEEPLFQPRQSGVIVGRLIKWDVSEVTGSTFSRKEDAIKLELVHIAKLDQNGTRCFIETPKVIFAISQGFSTRRRNFSFPSMCPTLFQVLADPTMMIVLHLTNPLTK